MSEFDRRQFVTRSAVGIGGLMMPGGRAATARLRAAVDSFDDPPAAPSGRRVSMLIRGLCVFVIPKNGAAAVVLMNASSKHPPVEIHAHAARLVAAADRVIDKADGTDIGEGLVSWTLRGYRMSIATAPNVTPTIPSLDIADQPWQPFTWLLDLTRAYPAGVLRSDLTTGADVVAGVVQLGGGRLEGATPSVGFGNIATWDLTSQEPQPKTWRQALTDQATYTLPVADAATELVINRQSLAGAASAPPIKLKMPNGTPMSAKPLNIVVDHDFHPDVPIGATKPGPLTHNVVFYDVFANGPALGPVPKPTRRTIDWVDSQGEPLPSGERTATRLQVNNGDPYCNLAMIRPR